MAVVAGRSTRGANGTRTGAVRGRPTIGLRRGLGAVFILGGLLLTIAWGAQLLEISWTGQLSAAYLDAPSSFWIIRIVDPGVLAPACLIVGVGLVAGRAFAIRAAYGLSVFLTLQGVAVLAMSGVVLWNQDPTSSVPFALALLPVCLGLGWLSLRLLRTSTAPDPARAPRGRIG